MAYDPRRSFPRCLMRMVAACLGFTATFAIAQIAEYDGVRLRMPTVDVAGAIFPNVVLRDIGSLVFDLESVGQGPAASPATAGQVPAQASATLNLGTGALSLPLVKVGGLVFSDVVLQRTSAPGYTFHLVSGQQRSAESLYYTDSFSPDPDSITLGLTQFWQPFGQHVRLDQPPGWVSLQENVTDVYTRIESGTFSPASKVRLKLIHRMTPSVSFPYYFFPNVDFWQTDGKAISLRWLRSMYSPDYCNVTGGYDRVLIRYADLSCSISNVASSSLYARTVESIIEVDVLAGTVRYFVDGGPTPVFTSAIPATLRQPIKKLSLGGYGWFTGHRHDVDSLEVTVRPSEDHPTPPLDPMYGSDGRPWLPTIQEKYNFAGKSTYWNLAPIDHKNHIGSDIALSKDGRLRVGSHMARRDVRAICAGTVVLNSAGPSQDPENAFLQVHHPNCFGRNLNVYYGHIVSGLSVGASVSIGQVVGAIADQGANSHLHLTIDKNPSRGLGTVKVLHCSYAALSGEVTSIHHCATVRSGSTYLPSDLAQLGAGKMLILRGFGKMTVLAYRNQSSTLFESASNLDHALYIQPDAMRCLGFIPLTDLWDSHGLNNLVCQDPGE